MAASAALVLVLFFPLIPSFPLLSQPVDGTSCDWNVWDDTVEEKGVQKISVRCSNGRVVWRTPYGGLAMTFLPPLRSQVYKVCFFAESNRATVQLFREGNQSLNHLAVLNETNPSLSHEICLNSTSDQALIIFAETDSSSSSPVHGKLILEYDIRAIEPSAKEQMQEECGPCSEEETLLAACTADYAVVGQIHSISENYDSDTSDLHVIVSHVIRQQYTVVQDWLGNNQHHDSQSYQGRFSTVRRSQTFQTKSMDRQNSRISRESKSLLSRDSLKNYYLPILVPGMCHVRQGKGAFLFLGSIRLRRARLECAPRLEEFERMWNSAVATGNAPCSLY